MLSADDQEVASGEVASVEERVRRLVMETAGFTATTEPLLGASLDSLTLIAIVTRIEAAFGVAFESDELVALLGAPDSSELAKRVARKVAERHANLDESARNESC